MPSPKCPYCGGPLDYSRVIDPPLPPQQQLIFKLLTTAGSQGIDVATLLQNVQVKPGRLRQLICYIRKSIRRHGRIKARRSGNTSAYYLLPLED